MNAHERVIEKFYTSFQQKDWKGMQDCYHPDIVFGDPVFQHLNGKEALAMWHMLVTAGKDLAISFDHIRAAGSEGSCDWEARYSFSRTGRKVHNIIHAEFHFKEDRIINHKDTFNLWRWSRMALGLSGILLGWSPLVQNKIRATAKASLRKFIEEHPDYR